jgi:hypothetical protein
MIRDVSITPISGNSKLGPIASTGRPRRTCPTTCTFNPVNPDGVGGCYTAGRIDAMYERYARDYTNADAVALLKRAKSDRLRDRVDGDVLTNGFIDLYYLRELTSAAKEAGMRWIFGYTHEEGLIPSDVPDGYVMNVSCETEEQVQDAIDRGFNAVIATHQYLHGDVVAGRKIVQCPAERVESINCGNCGGSAGPICGRADRETVVLFSLHGSGAAKAAKSIEMRMSDMAESEEWAWAAPACAGCGEPSLSEYCYACKEDRDV